MASNNDTKFHLQCPLHEVRITTTLVQVVIVVHRVQQQGQLVTAEPEVCTLWPSLYRGSLSSPDVLTKP